MLISVNINNLISVKELFEMGKVFNIDDLNGEKGLYLNGVLIHKRNMNPGSSAIAAGVSICETIRAGGDLRN